LVAINKLEVNKLEVKEKSKNMFSYTALTIATAPFTSANYILENDYIFQG
jgi:hypothetical protein